MGSSISIVIPALDAGATIGRCLETILALDLPGAGLEVIVVDNGSRDDTREQAGRFPVRVVREERRGRAFARNAGLAVSSAPLVAFVDSDCEVEPGWLKSLLPAFEMPLVGGAQGEVYRVYGDLAGGRIRELVRAPSSSMLFPLLDTAGCIYRREAIELAGRFDTVLTRSEDFDLSLRVLLCGYAVWTTDDAAVYTPAQQTYRGMLRLASENGRASAELYAKHREVFRYGPARVLANHLGAIAAAVSAPVREGLHPIRQAPRLIYAVGEAFEILKALPRLGRPALPSGAPAVRCAALPRPKLELQGRGLSLSENARIFRERDYVHILDLPSGERYSFGGSAPSFFACLLSGLARLDEIAQSMAAEFATEQALISKDLRALLGELESHGLFVPC